MNITLMIGPGEEIVDIGKSRHELEQAFCVNSGYTCYTDIEAGEKCPLAELRRGKNCRSKYFKEAGYQFKTFPAEALLEVDLLREFEQILRDDIVLLEALTTMAVDLPRDEYACFMEQTDSMMKRNGVLLSRLTALREGSKGKEENDNES